MSTTEQIKNFPNLNKENFWNDMRTTYPQAVDAFCKWIDEYKKAIQWDKFMLPSVKFHDIPYELQMGIMNRFFIENFASNEEYYADGKSGKWYHDKMRHALEQLNNYLNKRPIL